MRQETVSPTFGEDSWLFAARAPREASLEVIFSPRARVRRVRVSGRLYAVDDRDSDILEMASRLGIEVLIGLSERVFVPVVSELAEVRIWVSKVAHPETTANFRWSEVGR